MMRVLLFALLALGGCRFGATAGDVYQARGVTVALAVSGQGVVAGELLTVDADGFLIDAVDAVARPVRVVRVPLRDITRGAVYGGPVVAGEIRSVRTVPAGMERIARLGAAGTHGSLDLRALSRFPYGIPDGVLARLLHARVQTEVAGLDFAPFR